MLKVVESLQEAIDLMYNRDMFLSVDEVAALRRLLTRFGQTYQGLQVIAMDESLLRLKSTLKLHYVVGHLADQAELINPRRVQGYANESMAGEVCKI